MQYVLITGVDEILGSVSAPAGKTTSLSGNLPIRRPPYQTTSLSDDFKTVLVKLVGVKNLRMVITSRRASLGLTGDYHYDG
jgi:hypothetical protein